MIILGYIAAVLMGMVLGVIGGGGSILTVPILVYLMGVTPDIATGYSLLIVGATAAFGAVRYFKEGLVDVKASILFAVPSIIAVYLSRAYLMPAIPETISFQSLTIDKNLGIMVLFAALMLASAAMMLKKAYSKSTPATQVIEKKQPNIGLIVIEGAVVGVVTGILGAGGGFLIIPALVLIHYRLKVVAWLRRRPTNRNSIGDAFAAAYVGSHVYWDGSLHEGSGKTRWCSFAEVLCIFHSSYCRFYHDQRASLGEHP